jgi:hypothetical protein
MGPRRLDQRGRGQRPFGAAGSEKFYKIDVPAGQDELEILTTSGTGDVDLYVRLGALPTTTSYDYRPYKVGNEETVTVANFAAGTVSSCCAAIRRTPR